MGFMDIYFKLFDKILIKLVLLTFFLVIVCQTIIYYQPHNLKISLVDRLEGEQIILQEVYPAGSVDLAAKNITFRVVNPYLNSLPEAKIFLNGKEIGNFTNLQFSFPVEEGDNITIDPSMYTLDLSIQMIPSEELKTEEKLIYVKKGEKINITIENES